MLENTKQLIDHFAASLADGTFIKLTLGNYKGSEDRLQKLLIRLVETKKGTRLFVQYRFETRDIVRNHAFDEGVELVRSQLRSGFHSAHLFTTKHDYQLTIGKRSARLNIGKPSVKAKPATAHDRPKHTAVDQNAYYLQLLGITSENGMVLSSQRDKWKQINKFVEVLAGLYERSDLKGKDSIRMIDMGSGKGYLTFAAYDHFANGLSLDVRMTGVDIRDEQVAFCNEVARAGGMTELHFVQGAIADVEVEDVDILIALHACDTATDDALFKGIAAKASVIVAAPCCHREIRKQLRPPTALKGIMKHPVMLERTAEMVTDGLRALLLEKYGYSVKMFEFVATEHTPKNNMIVAVRTDDPVAASRAALQIEAAKVAFGIQSQHLEALLA